MISLFYSDNQDVSECRVPSNSTFALHNVSVSTMAYCSAQINCLPLPRFLKVTMTTAEERYEETWNNYLVLLNKDPNVCLASFPKSKTVACHSYDSRLS